MVRARVSTSSPIFLEYAPLFRDSPVNRVVSVQHECVGRAGGVGRGLGVTLGVALGVGVAVGVPVGVGLTVAVGVAVGDGVGVGPA